MANASRDYRFDLNVGPPHRTPAQVKVFAGEWWLDDVVDINYEVRTPKTPIYGFRSERWDAVVMGNSVVTGSLIINFRFPGYLNRVLERILVRIGNRQRDLFEPRYNATPGPYDSSILKALYGQSGTFEVSTSILSQTDPQEVRKMVHEAFLTSVQTGLSIAQQLRREFYVPPPESSGDPAGSLQARQNYGLDLTIRYGHEDDPYRATHVIRDVFIDSQGQRVSVLDGAGDSCLYEAYSFIGRSLEFA